MRRLPGLLRGRLVPARSTWTGRWPGSPPAPPSSRLAVLAAAPRPRRGVGHRARLRQRAARGAGRGRRLGARPRSARAEDIGFPRGPFSLRSSGSSPPGSAGSRATRRPPGGWGPRPWPSARSTDTRSGRCSARRTRPPAPPGAPSTGPRWSRRSRCCTLMGQESFSAAHLAYPRPAARVGRRARPGGGAGGRGGRVVARTGERVHLPELLRQRAAYAQDPRPRRGGGRVLAEAVRVADRAGSPGVPAAGRARARRAPARGTARRLAHCSRRCPGGPPSVADHRGDDRRRRAPGPLRWSGRGSSSSGAAWPGWPPPGS